MVSNGLKQVQTGSKWVKHGQTGSNRSKGIKLSQIGSNGVKQGEIGPNRVKGGQTESNGVKQGQTGPNGVKLKQGQTRSNGVDRGQSWAKQDQMVPNGAKWCQTGSNGVKRGQKVQKKKPYGAKCGQKGQTSPNGFCKKGNLIFNALLLQCTFMGVLWVSKRIFHDQVILAKKNSFFSEYSINQIARVVLEILFVEQF